MSTKFENTRKVNNIQTHTREQTYRYTHVYVHSEIRTNGRMHEYNKTSKIVENTAEKKKTGTQTYRHIHTNTHAHKHTGANG